MEVCFLLLIEELWPTRVNYSVSAELAGRGQNLHAGTPLASWASGS